MVIYNHIIVSSCDLIVCLDRKKKHSKQNSLSVCFEWNIIAD